jgi:hypothetical protein
MGWLGVKGEIVNRVGNSISAGSTYIGDSGHITGTGISGIGASIDAGAAEGGIGGG